MEQSLSQLLETLIADGHLASWQLHPCELHTFGWIAQYYRQCKIEARSSARSFKLLGWKAKRREAVQKALYWRHAVRALAHWQTSCHPVFEPCGPVQPQTGYAVGQQTL